MSEHDLIWLLLGWNIAWWTIAIAAGLGQRWARRHRHEWKPWPGRDGWEFCPNCPASRNVG